MLTESEKNLAKIGVCRLREWFSKHALGLFFQKMQESGSLSRVFFSFQSGRNRSI